MLPAAAVRVADSRVMVVCPPILTSLLRGHRGTTASRNPHLKPVRSERRPAYDHVRERRSSHSGDLSGLPSSHDRGHGRRHGLARPIRRRAESVECFSTSGPPRFRQLLLVPQRDSAARVGGTALGAVGARPDGWCAALDGFVVATPSGCMVPPLECEPQAGGNGVRLSAAEAEERQDGHEGGEIFIGKLPAVS